jgi:hypothetical protein
MWEGGQSREGRGSACGTGPGVGVSFGRAQDRLSIPQTPVGMTQTSHKDGDRNRRRRSSRSTCDCSIRRDADTREASRRVERCRGSPVEGGRERRVRRLLSRSFAQRFAQRSICCATIYCRVDKLVSLLRCWYGCAAVYGENRAGGEAGGVAGEVERGAYDFMGVAGALHRKGLRAILELLGMRPNLADVG